MRILVIVYSFYKCMNERIQGTDRTYVTLNREILSWYKFQHAVTSSEARNGYTVSMSVINDVITNFK